MRGFFQQLKINHRIWIIVLIAVAGFIVNSAIELFDSKQQMLTDRKIALRNAVEVAHSVINHYYQQAKNAELNTESAQKNAIATVKDLRFEGKEYFFVQTGSVMIMHPFVPAMNGKDVADLKDKNGKLFVLEMVNNVQKDGEGFVEYSWPHGGSDVPVPKITYVKGFPEWNWIVGSGVYIDDIDEAFYSMMLSKMGRLIPGVIFLLLLSGMLAKSIQARLIMTQEAMANIAEGEGDLTQRLDERGADEISDVAREFNKFCARIQTMVKQMNSTSQELLHSVKTMSQAIETANAGLRQQQIETNQVAIAVNEMSSTVHEVSRNASHTAESALKADEQAQQTKSVVDDNMTAIGSLADSVSSAFVVIDQLQEESKSVAGILDVIKGITEQTNLLALNAAIEAARAGEQGRGFAVVADEVRTLANRTKESTSEIQNVIINLQNKAESAVKAIAGGKSQAEQGVSHATKVNDSLGDITQSISVISDMNTQIATAAEEQAVVTEEINKNITRISSIADESMNSAKNAEASAEKVYALIDELDGLVKQFKVD
ncbi:methyl-accepting chemotaxis protein [Paraneptunicella aestuarii]|uniref:methyl-accepting chemotaxis protein n=1 Tax=Paraneptunicella aestuarii TaxID=2831148 RepID=UPI001E531737|nr:methyl-accepting chemotaxis protein [Paraneptunicella aestuarii]UAA39841.1 methyl-accepting chemotaxis protein [Paraneptunicella aestuarii]